MARLHDRSAEQQGAFEVVARFARVAAVYRAPGMPLQTAKEGDLIWLTMGEALLSSRWTAVQATGIVLAVMGLAATLIGPWGWVCGGAGILIAILGPHYLRPPTLLVIDVARGEIIVRQTAKIDGGTLPIAEIAAFHCAKTADHPNTWTVSAERTCGASTPLLASSHENLCPETCSLLGYLFCRRTVFCDTGYGRPQTLQDRLVG